MNGNNAHSNYRVCTAIDKNKEQRYLLSQRKSNRCPLIAFDAWQVTTKSTIHISVLEIVDGWMWLDSDLMDGASHPTLTHSEDSFRFAPLSIHPLHTHTAHSPTAVSYFVSSLLTTQDNIMHNKLHCSSSTNKFQIPSRQEQNYPSLYIARRTGDDVNL